MDYFAIAQLLGNIGELVAAIAVVATLFYLAVQVRQSKDATNANTRSLEQSREFALNESAVDASNARQGVYEVIIKKR